MQVEKTQVLLREGGVQLLLTVVDTPGFGDSVDNSNWYVTTSCKLIVAISKWKQFRIHCFTLYLDLKKIACIGKQDSVSGRKLNVTFQFHDESGHLLTFFHLTVGSQ